MLYDKKAFTVAESLVSLFILSLIMSLYLPALYLELSRTFDKRQEVAAWYALDQLVKYYYEDNESYHQSFEVISVEFHNKTSLSIDKWNHDLNDHWIELNDGRIFQMGVQAYE